MRKVASCSSVIVDLALAQALAGRWTRSSGSVAQAESSARDVMESTTLGA